jgi:hypothetical protein
MEGALASSKPTLSILDALLEEYDMGWSPTKRLPLP